MTGRKHGHSFNDSTKGKNTMQFRVTCSTADGDETKDFNNWKDAHLYAYEWMFGFTHWNHCQFNEVESDEHINLWQTRKGECVHITEIRDDGEIETRSEDEENREWYRQRASGFEFHPMMTTCGYCNEREACYNGITQAVYNVIDEEAINGVIFQFCKICCDELLMIKLQTKVSRERIGA